MTYLAPAGGTGLALAGVVGAAVCGAQRLRALPRPSVAVEAWLAAMGGGRQRAHINEDCLPTDDEDGGRVMGAGAGGHTPRRIIDARRRREGHCNSHAIKGRKLFQPWAGCSCSYTQILTLLLIFPQTRTSERTACE